MAGERYADKVIVSLKARLVANLETQLRAVETAQGLASGFLTNPIAYVSARVPNDNRSPLIQLFEVTDGPRQPAGQRHRLHQVDCIVGMTFTSGPDLEAGAAFVRKYATAIKACVEQDPTLGGTVSAAIIGDAVTVNWGDQSATRFGHTIEVMVLVHTP